MEYFGSLLWSTITTSIVIVSETIQGNCETILKSKPGSNKMITKKKEGYYVISEKTKRNLGGPYKTIEEAKKRLRQVEFFKHLKGK